MQTHTKIGLALLAGLFALGSPGLGLAGPAPAGAPTRELTPSPPPRLPQTALPTPAEAKTPPAARAHGATQGVEAKGPAHAGKADASAHRAKRAKAKAGDLALAGAKMKPGKPQKDLLGAVVFFFLAFGCAGFSIVMITRKSAMMSALSLLVVFLCLAGIYVLLKAPFMAAIQLIVYAGAIIVLFIFVIMSMGLQEAYSPRDMAKEVAYFMGGFLLTGCAALVYFFSQGLVGLALAGLLLVGTGVGFVVYLDYPFTRLLGMAAAAFAGVQLMRLATLTSVAIEVPRAAGDPTVSIPLAAPLADDFGSAQSVGRSVFLENAFAFEALALLLLAAVVAAVVIVRSRKEAES